MPEVPEGTNGTSGTPFHSVLVEKTIDSPVGLTTGARPGQLLSRLQAGSKWLRCQHAKYVNDDPAAATDEEFSAALAGWDLLEQELRSTGHTECVFGAGQRCLEEAPATCDWCIAEPLEVTTTAPPSFGGVQGTLLP